MVIEHMKMPWSEGEHPMNATECTWAPFEWIWTSCQCNWVHMKASEWVWARPECVWGHMNTTEWVWTPLNVIEGMWMVTSEDWVLRHFGYYLWLQFLFGCYCLLSLWYHVDKTWEFWSSVSHYKIYDFCEFWCAGSGGAPHTNFLPNVHAVFIERVHCLL